MSSNYAAGGYITGPGDWPNSRYRIGDEECVVNRHGVCIRAAHPGCPRGEQGRESGGAA